MAAVDVRLVSCAVCGNIAFLAADAEDGLYFLCMVCQRVTPITYIQEQVKAGNKLKRVDPRAS